MRIALLAALLCGCASEEPSRAEVRGEEPSHRAAARALAYTPGDGVTDVRIARAQEVVRARPNEAEPLASLAVLFVRRHRETGDPEVLRCAQDAVESALDRDPDHPTALSVSGMLAMQAHRFRDAAQIARRILDQEADDTTALLLLGDAHLEMGVYDEALEAHQRALDLRPDLRSYNRGAHLRWLNGDPQGALELLQLAIDAGSTNDPESLAWCWVDLANVHWHLGNLAQVRVALDRALALVPRYAAADRLRARLLAAEGDRAGAIAIMEALIARPNVADLLSLAELLEAEGRAEDARARVREAERIGREDPRSLAWYRARRGEETADALRAIERELRTREDIVTHAAHAMALAREGQHDRARAAMDRALALETPDVNLILADALVRQLAGDADGSRASLERARSLNPHADPWLVRALETPQ